MAKLVRRKKKYGKNSTTDELCRNVAKSANAHFNYH